MAAKIKHPASIVNNESIDNLIKWQKKIDKLAINGSQLAMIKSANAAIKNLPVTGFDLAITKQANQRQFKFSKQGQLNDMTLVFAKQVKETPVQHFVPASLLNENFKKIKFYNHKIHNNFIDGKTLNNLVQERHEAELNLIDKVSSISEKLLKFDLDLGTLQEVLEKESDSIINARIPIPDNEAPLLVSNFNSERILKAVRDLSENLTIHYGNNLSLFDVDLHEILAEIKEVRKQCKLVQVLKKQIDFVLNQIKKRLINLREFFTKTHSFHFKNLDDYHSSTLVSVIR